MCRASSFVKEPVRLDLLVLFSTLQMPRSSMRPANTLLRYVLSVSGGSGLLSCIADCVGLCGDRAIANLGQSVPLLIFCLMADE